MGISEPLYSIELWFQIAVDGKATGWKGAGKFWIDKDMLCQKWENVLFQTEWCGPVYRNPQGSPESSDDYLLINEMGIWPFTLED